MTFYSAIVANDRAHARFYPCMRRADVDLPKETYGRPFFGATLRIGDWFRSFCEVTESASTARSRFQLISRHPQRAGTEKWHPGYQGSAPDRASGGAFSLRRLYELSATKIAG